jgi:transposase, IS5 family
MRQGTIVDATIIAAPPSTKNNSKTRDPEMHQTKKGNQWHFGMKAHIGVDVASGVVHTLTGTAANEADINQTAALLHGREEAVFADAGYTGADKRPELEDRDVSWNIAIKRSIIKALPKALRDWAEAVESALSQVRAWVEHPFHIVKNPGLRRGRLCSTIKSCAIAAWPRTRRNCTRCSRWPTWSSSRKHSSRRAVPDCARTLS